MKPLPAACWVEKVRKELYEGESKREIKGQIRVVLKLVSFVLLVEKKNLLSKK